MSTSKAASCKCGRHDRSSSRTDAMWMTVVAVVAAVAAAVEDRGVGE